MTAFGPDRLIWGSNWPVITLHGTFEAQIAIAEEYLAPFGTAVRDKVMFRNALAFYRRHKPSITTITTTDRRHPRCTAAPGRAPRMQDQIPSARQATLLAWQTRVDIRRTPTVARRT